jgi:methylated-DNA-protein-cysteine methyltransferase-like protein
LARRSTAARPRRAAGLFWQVYRVVARVPRGRVASYGQIARIVGCSARQVGYALAATPEGLDLPWQRIVNREGRISLPGASGAAQRARLEAEGIRFDVGGRIELRRFGWKGRRAPRRRK